jgi:hypothetical protein
MMIKKFNEYIKEDKRLIDFISIDELEDQFLRLKEIYDCLIYINRMHSENISYYIYTVDIGVPDKNLQKTIKEIDNVKNRLQSIYHLKMKSSLEKEDFEKTGEMCWFSFIVYET